MGQNPELFYPSQSEIISSSWTEGSTRVEDSPSYLGLDQAVTRFSHLASYLNAPELEISEGIEKIQRAYNDFYAEDVHETKMCTSAFLIHSRRNPDDLENYDPEIVTMVDDIGLIFPALQRKYGSTPLIENEIDKFWNSLPPFEVGKTEGILPDGTPISMSLISVPITPKGLEERNGSLAKRAKYARKRIEDATKLAEKFGAQIVGLGEVLGSLTDHGKVLQRSFPDIKIATGHSGTTYYIAEWVKYFAGNENLADVPITIIGAEGAIGRAVTDIITEFGVRNISLHDKEDKLGGLVKKQRELEDQFSDISISIHTGDKDLKAACQGKKIIISAASATQPFITAEHLDEGTYIIDDSQPTVVTRQEADKKKCTLVWPLGKHPEGIERDFPYGPITLDADFGCALEVMMLHTLPKDKRDAFESTGKVDIQKVKMIEKLAKNLDLGLPSPQSFGKPYSTSA